MFYLSNYDLKKMIEENKNHIPPMFRPTLFSSKLKVKQHFEGSPKQYNNMSGSCIVLNYQGCAYEIDWYYDDYNEKTHYVVFKYDYDTCYYDHGMDLLYESAAIKDYNNYIASDKICKDCYEIGV